MLKGTGEGDARYLDQDVGLFSCVLGFTFVEKAEKAATDAAAEDPTLPLPAT